MDIGTIGFRDQKQVIKIEHVERNREIEKRIEKTRREVRFGPLFASCFASCFAFVSGPISVRFSADFCEGMVDQEWPDLQGVSIKGTLGSIRGT